MNQHEFDDEVAGTKGVLFVSENDAVQGRNGSKRYHSM